MRRLLVQNHLFRLPSFDLTGTEVLYAPVFQSEVQRLFFQKRFEEIRTIAPQARWSEELDESDYDLALSVDAVYERRAFGGKLAVVKNRLFDELPFPVSETFTPFREKAEAHLPQFYDDAVPPFSGELIQELDYYFREKRLPLTYLETRNELTGRDGSTKFSAYLSSGLLDVRHLYNEVRRFEELHGATKSTSWIVFELLWREYFYWHYQKHPRAYFSKAGLRGLDFSPPTEYSPEELRLLTGEPFFHAALNELLETGFLSNRARQIFASIWINDLNLDWRSGAAFFEGHLIDYDVYSNYGNWMYLAGVGVDPRGKRYFNVKKQLELCDPLSTYLKRWS